MRGLKCYNSHTVTVRQFKEIVCIGVIFYPVVYSLYSRRFSTKDRLKKVIVTQKNVVLSIFVTLMTVIA